MKKANILATTETGSIYEIDTENTQIRRLRGDKNPTPLQGKDGEYKKYIELSEPTIGQPLVILWADPEKGYIQPATRTSLIVKINNSYEIN